MNENNVYFSCRFIFENRDDFWLDSPKFNNEEECLKEIRVFKDSLHWAMKLKIVFEYKGFILDTSKVIWAKVSDVRREK